MLKRIGLALGGGGLRGAAHIGILQYLTEQGLEFSCLAGTSAGSIVAGLYASGMSPDDIADWAMHVSPREILDFPGFCTALDVSRKAFFHQMGLPAPRFRNPMGLIRGNRLEWMFNRLTNGLTMEELNIPTSIVATDIRTAEMVVFTSPALVRRLKPRMPSTLFYSDVPVSIAIRASTAIPGVFVPRRVDPHMLVDGGIQNNVPADLAAYSGVDAVIAVDLGYAHLAEEQLDNILEILLQATDIMQYQITKSVLRYADMVIQPDTGNVNLTSFNRIPELIEIGRKAAQQAWPQIRRLVA